MRQFKKEMGVLAVGIASDKDSRGSTGTEFSINPPKCITSCCKLGNVLCCLPYLDGRFVHRDVAVESVVCSSVTCIPTRRRSVSVDLKIVGDIGVYLEELHVALQVCVRVFLSAKGRDSFSATNEDYLRGTRAG